MIDLELERKRLDKLISTGKATDNDIIHALEVLIEWCNQPEEKSVKQ